MGKPRKVAEAEEKANQMINNLKAQTSAPSENGSQNVNQPQQASTVESTPEQASITTEPTVAPEQTQAPLEQQQQTQEPQSQQEQMVPLKDLEKLQNSYNSLQGRMNQELNMRKSEKQVYEEQFEKFKSEILAVTSQLAAMQQQVNTQPQGPVDPKKLSYIKQEDVETFGDSMIDMVYRGTKSVVEPEIKQLKERLAVQEKQNFVSNLRIANRDFDKINNDPDFIEWLKSTQDGNSGFTKHESLSDAFEKRDMDRTLSFFDEWNTGGNKKESALKSQKLDISSRVSPSRIVQQSAPVQQKKIYTPQEYQQLALSLSARRFSLEQAEQVKKELDDAIREGRIKAA